MPPPRSIHLQMTHVRAAEGRNALGSAEAYIEDSAHRELDAETSVEAAIAYLEATGRHRDQSSRVIAVEFLCRGQLDSERVWHQLDASFRTKMGEYSCRGGNRKTGVGGRARLAVFCDATLPYELSESEKLEAGRELMQLLVDRYGCAAKIAWHAKDGRIDHFHLLLSTKAVDANGVGPIIRDFNGIASKATERAEDGTRVSTFTELTRRAYAEILTRRTGIAYCEKSFKRQNRTEQPARHISREDLRTEALSGTNSSMSRRRQLLAARAVIANTEIVLPSVADVKSLPAAGTKRHEKLEIPALDVASLVALTMPTSANSPIAPSHIPSSGRSTSDAKSDEELAQIIIDNVNAAAREDAAAFLREQALAERKRRELAAWLPSAIKRPKAELRLRRIGSDTAANAAATLTPTQGQERPFVPSKVDRPQIDTERQRPSPANAGEAQSKDSPKPTDVASGQNNDVTASPVQITLLSEGHVEPELAPPVRRPGSVAVAAAGKSSANQKSEQFFKLPDQAIPAPEVSAYSHDHAPLVQSPPSKEDTKAKGANDTKLKTASINLCAWHLRMHGRYQWEDELIELAEMERMAFRAAVNEAVTIHRNFSVEDHRRFIARLVKTYAALARYADVPRQRQPGRSQQGKHVASAKIDHDDPKLR